MSDSNQGGNFMPKEELAASGSGHLLLTDFDDDEKEDVEDSMVEFANQQGIDKTRYKKHYFPVLKREILIFTKLEDFWPPSTSYLQGYILIIKICQGTPVLQNVSLVKPYIPVRIILQVKFHILSWKE